MSVVGANPEELAPFEYFAGWHGHRHRLRGPIRRENAQNLFLLRVGFS